MALDVAPRAGQNSSGGFDYRASGIPGSLRSSSCARQWAILAPRARQVSQIAEIKFPIGRVGFSQMAGCDGIYRCSRAMPRITRRSFLRARSFREALQLLSFDGSTAGDG